MGKILLICVMLGFMAQVHAAAPEEKEAPLYDSRQAAPEDERIEPSVVITEDESITIKEYRVKGELYMIEILPRKGRPYYLVDSDGDGSLDSRYGELTPNFLIPSWVILKW